MSPRINYTTAAPEAFQAMLAISQYVDGCGLEHSLMELVKTRASQINGCAFCIDMHTRDARAAGEREERLYLLSAWRESKLYTPRERAALAWTDAMTTLDDHDALSEAFDDVRSLFTEDETVKLALAIGVINVWNRINVGFQVEPPVIQAKAS
jgi:AhpD family alkylhydroperoxidase